MTATETQVDKAPALERILVSCPPNHPSGQRGRAGFVFTKVPTLVDVTPEQKKAIEKDPYLTIHRKTSRAWFTAHGLEYTDANIKQFEGKDPPRKGAQVETAHDAPGSTEVKPDEGDSTQTTNTPPAPTGDQVVAPVAPLADGEIPKGPEFTNFAAKQDVIDALVKFKGQKPNEGFNPDASRDSLLALYRSLPDVAPTA